jgi:hypothetical protein
MCDILCLLVTPASGKGGEIQNMTFYCVKCREKKDVNDANVEHGTAKNGRPFVKAECPTCGTKMFKFVKSE